MSTTDELRERIAKAIAFGVIGWMSEEEWDQEKNARFRTDYLDAADAVLAVLAAPGQRMVSMEEAEELPAWSIIRDGFEAVLEKEPYGGWWGIGEEFKGGLHPCSFPAQVLWTPEDVTE